MGGVIRWHCLSLYLRRDVAFHDNQFFSPTRPLNSDDVLFTFRRLLDPEHPLHKFHGQSYEDKIISVMARDIQEIRKIDDYKFDIVLHRPNSEIINILSQDYTSILSREYGDFLIETERPARFDLFPIGTGPYRVKAYQQNLLLKPSPLYPLLE